MDDSEICHHGAWAPRCWYCERAAREKAERGMDELRRACADVLKEDPETWPTHGNAALAIAAALTLACLARENVEAELKETVAIIVTARRAPNSILRPAVKDFLARHAANKEAGDA